MQNFCIEVVSVIVNPLLQIIDGLDRLLSLKMPWSEAANITAFKVQGAHGFQQKSGCW